MFVFTGVYVWLRIYLCCVCGCVICVSAHGACVCVCVYVCVHTHTNTHGHRRLDVTLSKLTGESCLTGDIRTCNSGADKVNFSAKIF